MFSFLFLLYAFLLIFIKLPSNFSFADLQRPFGMSGHFSALGSDLRVCNYAIKDREIK